MTRSWGSASEFRRPSGAAVLAMALLQATPASAGAWLRPEGEGEIIFKPEIMIAGRRFDNRRRAGRADRFAKNDNGATIEYGIRPDLTLIVLASQRGEVFLRNGDPQRVMTSSVGGGLRIALWRGGSTVVSAQVTGTSGLERSFPGLERRFGPRHEVDGRVLAGHGFAIGGWPAFLEAQLGYRWRSTRHADELRLDLTFGVRPVPRLLILMQAFNTLALQRGPAEGGGRARQHKLQASAVLDLTDTWSLQAGVFAAVAGQDTLKERGVTLGLWRKF